MFLTIQKTKEIVQEPNTTFANSQIQPSKNSQESATSSDANPYEMSPTDLNEKKDG